jgi:hypothetical protein
VAIRVEKDPMGMGGKAWYVESPSDLEKLPKEAASLLTARAVAIFREPRGSLAKMASEAPLPAMARWLEALAGARCELEVFATKHYGRDCRLRFHFEDGPAPSFRAAAGEPRLACPEIVTRIHAITGHIDFQFGCSGTLVALDELQTLKELVKEQRVLNFEELETTLSQYPELGDYVGVFETDGDWLCTNAEGRSIWVGGEWLGDDLVESALDLASILEGFFDALAGRTYFRPSVED